MIEAIVIVLFLLVLLLSHGWSSVPLLSVFALVLLVCFPGIWVILRKNPPFVPTTGRARVTTLAFAHLQPGDAVYDLGCGDGSLVRACAALGARATGFELSVPLFLFAKTLSAITKKGEIRFKNFWSQDFRRADVLLCYFVRETMDPFMQRIWPTLKPGCRVVSHVHPLPGVPCAQHENGVYLFVKEG